MSQATHVGSLSPFTYAGMAGLSFATLIGIFKLWKHLFQSDDAPNRIDRDRTDKTDNEVTSLRKLLGATRLDAIEKDEALERLKKELSDRQNQLEELQRLLQGTRSHNQALGDQVKGQAREGQILRDEILQVKTRHTHAQELLEARTLELKSTETFLRKADTLSGSDVIAMLNTLNAEIYQTAASVAESFAFREKGPTLKETRRDDVEDMVDMDEVYASATEILGSRMVELLRTSEHHEDPTLIQIAFQAGMSAYSSWIVTAWYFEDPQDDHLLGEIYARVREAEEQGVSGRWRALTRAHVQRMTDHEPDLAMYFIDAFTKILLTAGVHHNQSTLQDVIEERFGERVAIIVRSAQRLRKAIGEEVTSCDFEILHTAQEVPFDPSRMDDAFASGYEKGRESQELVLCTTDLGLARVARLPGKVGEWDEAILLRPKIVLQSGIEEMMAGDTA